MLVSCSSLVPVALDSGNKRTPTSLLQSNTFHLLYPGSCDEIPSLVSTVMEMVRPILSQ